nr:hypothetical protein [Mycobacterium kubicae]
MFTTRGISEPAGGGFPAITLLAEFLLKDIVLLVASSGHWPMRFGRAGRELSTGELSTFWAPPGHPARGGLAPPTTEGPSGATLCYSKSRR